MGNELNQIINDLGGLNLEGLGPWSLLAFALALLISLAGSLFVSWLYVVFFRPRTTGSNIHRSFPLLGISITAIFICIQFSLPLSLGLLGALSIVRFRTPVKEPEEIGFIMVVVATALACATFNIYILGLLLAIALIALMCVRSAGFIFNGRSNEGSLIISLARADFDRHSAGLLTLLGGKAARGRVDSIVHDGDNTILTYSFRRLDEGGIGTLQGEVRALSSSASLSVFFNRSGDI